MEEKIIKEEFQGILEEYGMEAMVYAFRFEQKITSLEALYQCKPVIIPDSSVYKENHPVEYELYSRCYADAILAVPFLA